MMTETELQVVRAKGEPVLVDPSNHIIADLATMGKASIKDMAMGSMWQTGPVSPEFLRLVPKEKMISMLYDQVNIITTIQGVSRLMNSRGKISGRRSHGQVYPCLCLQV